jgi:predicted HicB family RNase H-like nuclease
MVVAEQIMAPKRKGKTKRDDRAVKIDRNVADKAQFIAQRRGISLAEYVTDLIRTAVEKDFAKALKELGEGGAK